MESFQAFLMQGTAWKPELAPVVDAAAQPRHPPTTAALLRQAAEGAAASPLPPYAHAAVGADGGPGALLAYAIRAYRQAEVGVPPGDGCGQPLARVDAEGLAKLVQRVWAVSLINQQRWEALQAEAEAAAAQALATPPGQALLLSDAPPLVDVLLPARADFFWREESAVANLNGGTTGDGPPSSAVLSCLPFSLPAQTLTCVQGAVGAGKSTFLLSLLAETFTPGDTFVFQRIPGGAGEGGSDVLAELGDGAGEGVAVARPQCGLVPQQPWLFNTTIRDNILFGTGFPFDRERYDTACECCCLADDFATLVDGDQTVVGDNGENLSGGQRQRVSLARAANSKCSVVLLDDVLSALDPAVATAVFERCILGLMQDRTRVLVSHSELVADCADQVFMVQDKQLKLTACSPHLGHHLLRGANAASYVRVRRPATSLLLSLPLDAGKHAGPVEPAAELGHAANEAGTSRAAAAPAAAAAKAGAAGEAAPPRRSGCGRGLSALGTFIGDYNRGLGMGPAAAANLALFVAECSTVETGVWFLAIYTEKSKEKGGPADPFYIYMYMGLTAAELVISYCRSLTQ